MGYKKGVVHLLPIILIAAIIIGVYFLIYKFVLKKNLPFTKQEPKVELKTEYKNPFNKNTQYVNPFDEFKNPLLGAR